MGRTPGSRGSFVKITYCCVGGPLVPTMRKNAGDATEARDAGSENAFHELLDNVRGGTNVRRQREKSKSMKELKLVSLKTE